MRSQALLRRSQSLLKASPLTHLTLATSTARLACAKRSPLFLWPAGQRLSSSAAPLSPPPEDIPEAAEKVAEVPEPSTEDVDKPKSRRTRTTASSTSQDSEPLELPQGIDILWSPESCAQDTESTYSSALPPPDVLEDALNNLLITLHPQTQHRAAYPSASGTPIEPTLGLYCPIEGGEYIIDATVRELARRTGAEVLVLDSVQLAAGEWGQFGKAANALQLPRNPLHFPSSNPSTSVPNRGQTMMDDDDDTDNGLPMFSQPQQMTLTVMAPPTLQGRGLLTPSSRRSAPPSKIKVFFDTLVNIPSNQDELVPKASKKRPRLIYIRDFPTLAPSSSVWYSPLLSAVRQRRRGPISRPTTAVSNPITIIFGMTPSLMPPISSDGISGPGSGLMSLLMSRNAPASKIAINPKLVKADWGEDELSEKAREKRLRERLRKWEKSDSSLHEELPRLSSGQESDETGGNKPDIIVIGGGGGIPGLSPMLGSSLTGGSGGRNSDVENTSTFFRTSVLVPNTRSSAHERTTRMARRREINELTMRMGVGAVGGTIEAGSAAMVATATSNEDKVESRSTSTDDLERMWEEWGNRIEVWSNVRKIADRAIGSVMSSSVVGSNGKDSATLDSTTVPWTVIHSAWAVHRSSREKRKAWMKEISPPSKALREEENEEEETRKNQPATDEVIEHLKMEGELDNHEQRLLSCIVDAASMPTSFSQVHLPPHTIDAVRTIVSLPLLHPQAFQQGILKEHGMTGCLLFGPPGTGKTLVVRALAKEAGCRMITISPSDVMDMYVGEGEKLVRAVFSLARRLSPCVVFLDEIDALFGARTSARESGGSFAHRGVITEFMQEMDGLKSSREDNVIVIGATNRPFDLDDAVLRRLPRRLLVDLPGEKEREEIFKILLRDEDLAADVNVQDLAKKTEGFSGSDLKHVCVSAALDAVKEHVHLPWISNVSITALLDATAAAPEETMPTPTASAPVPGAVRQTVTSSEDTTAILSTESPDALVAADSALTLPSPDEQMESTPVARILHLRNFTKALKEITPSSSESLGSLSELRKWNDEFGEGRRDRKKRQVWGKGKFGFIDHGKGDKATIQVTPSPALNRTSDLTIESTSRDP
ncbi:hypothetical protein BDQ12DRAFT_719513 [Crucibulum laeve]|uniref:AAA+ ATPase domain-containing protein n=1 Tax=Crucibulum laeve TaxID=68775 RepID=A0A5C3MBT7_9AGAR|nr:hypothetical protein BDQ12DRAFT_719513 [Crucibulum laeve]